MVYIFSVFLLMRPPYSRFWTGPNGPIIPYTSVDPYFLGLIDRGWEKCSTKSMRLKILPPFRRAVYYMRVVSSETGASKSLNLTAQFYVNLMRRPISVLRKSVIMRFM